MKKVLFFLCILYVSHISAQRNFVKIYAGQSYYQGDVSPSSINLSFSPGNFTYGIGYSKGIKPWLSIGVDVMKGKLSGSDINSMNLDRRRRNLSFYSDILEYNLNAEINIVQLFTDTSFYGIDIFYKTGVGVLTIDPRTLLNGQEYILRDYNTEGQGLPGGPKPYGKNHLVIPFGLALKFDLTPQFAIGIEAIARWTFTDYLDDVSGNYPDLTALESNFGSESVMLSYRRDSIDPSDYSRISGTARGDVTDNDWYTFVGLSLQYKWPKHLKRADKNVK